MVIEVNKDIDRYQESVAMGLTARQLIFSIASIVVGVGIVLLLYKYIGLTGSAYRDEFLRVYGKETAFYVWKQGTYLCVN